MRQSMTGFASLQGGGQGLSWTWELRGVNGKGLDLRLRLPDWIDGLEPAVRKRTGDALTRGNIQISLRLSSDESSSALRLDPALLGAVLDAIGRIEAEAMDRGMTLKPSTAADIVALRGVLTTESSATDHDATRAALLSDFDAVLADFIEMRAREGGMLQDVLVRQLSEIEDLVGAAERAVDAREGERRERLRTQLSRVMEEFGGVDEARLAQELAVIAVKADITEEIDRLRAHVGAARDLLAQDGPVGRKLDFLAQEFNREANTLCSKSGDAALTQTGLALKSAIDQMREQIQNVE